MAEIEGGGLVGVARHSETEAAWGLRIERGELRATPEPDAHETWLASPLPPGVRRSPLAGAWRHFKGERYEVLAEAQDPAEGRFVVYRCPQHRIWLRPLSMWEEVVERDGYAGSRFTRCYATGRSRLGEVDDDLLPSPEDTAEFERRGWWLSPVILPAAAIDTAVEAVNRYHEGARDAPIPPEHPTLMHEPLEPKPFYDWRPGDGDGMRENDMVAQQSDGLAQLVMHPMIAATAARLLRTPVVRLYTSTLLTKPPNLEGDRGKVGWHADMAYMRNCSAERMITAWIALHDCPVEMGPITMADGSHLWPHEGPIRELRMRRTFRSGEVERLLGEIESEGYELERVPVEVKRGQVSFHDHRIFHGSDLNLTQRSRQTLIVELQPGDNRYVPRAGGADGPLYVHQMDRRCVRTADDRPDYTDPLLCPVLWDDSWRQPV